MTASPTAGAFASIVARNRQQAYDVLVEAVEQSELSQVRIAQSADVSPEHLSRMLKRPRNLELDTLSRIVFAACGAAISMSLKFPQTKDATIRVTATTSGVFTPLNGEAISATTVQTQALESA